MNTEKLAREYLERCKKRLLAIEVLFKEQSFADVIRESQEVVELCGKGLLRGFGIDPPKWHDVGSIVVELSEKIPDFKDKLEKYAEYSKWLRKERELSFYGEIDFIPSEEYKKEDAGKALNQQNFLFPFLRKF